MANKALEQTDVQDVLNKIKSTILKEKGRINFDFERYKAEYLGPEWDDYLDSLSRDDLLFGMARCVEIIEKYITPTKEHIEYAQYLAQRMRQDLPKEYTEKAYWDFICKWERPVWVEDEEMKDKEQAV